MKELRAGRGPATGHITRVTNETLLGVQGDKRGWSVRRVGDNLYRFEIFGFNSDRWLLAFCDRLFAERVNIISGKSTREEDGLVSGEFTLEVTRVATRIFEIEISDLPRPVAKAVTPYSISISDYALSRSPRYGGSIRLDITGLDRPGFLRTFFRSLREIDLEIAGTEISTVDLQVRDSFWLRPPDPTMMASRWEDLETLLESLMDPYWAV